MYFPLEYKLSKSRDFIYFVLCSVLSTLNSGCHIVGAQLIFVERTIEGNFFLYLSGCYLFLNNKQDFPGGTVVKNLPANAGDMGSSPGPGRSHMPWSN